MERDLIKFDNYVEIINKEYSKYQDDKGMMFLLNTYAFLCKVEVLELSKEEYQKAKFEGKIDDIEYKIVKVDRPVPKYTITKKEEDKYIITNSQVDVRVVYNVSNSIGIHKSFTNKEEALALAEKINAKYLEVLK